MPQLDSELPPLRSRVDELLRYINNNSAYLQHNATLFEIFSGRLLPFVLEVLKKTLSEQYFERIKSRVIPINILTRYIDKLSRIYVTDVMRTTINKQHQTWINDTETELDVNNNFNIADEFANLFKGYALEPYLNAQNNRKLRVLPFDRFLVKSNSLIDDTEMDTFIKFIGKRSVRTRKGTVEDRDIYYAYTATEFWAFDKDGEDFRPAIDLTDGKNPFGVIPFMYGNRSKHHLLPIQDTDLLALTKMIPVLLTDLGGALMFQMFSIIFGIDLDSENIVMSPNAFWNFKSDPASNKTPSIGTIKPEVDADKVRSFIREVFVTWLETKGIKVGSVGSLQGDNSASGISKAIDEMDTFELRKKNIQWFIKEEKRFWNKYRIMNNYWVSTRMVKGILISDDFEISITHDPPKPLEDRMTNVQTVKLEVDSGFLDQKTAIERLYPDLTEEEVDERMELVGPQTITEKEEDAETPGKEEEEEEVYPLSTRP